MCSNLKDLCRKPRCVLQPLSCALALLSFSAAYGIPTEQSLEHYPAAVVHCTSKFYSTETDSSELINYGVTVFDNNAKDSWLQQEPSPDTKQKIDAIVLNILESAGISEGNEYYETRCDPINFTRIAPVSGDQKELADPIPYKKTSLSFYLVSHQKDGQVKHLNRKLRAASDPDPAEMSAGSGALSSILSWSENAKLTMLATTGIALIILTGPGIISIIPGGIYTAVLAVYGSSLVLFNQPEGRRRITGALHSAGIFIISKYDNFLIYLGAEAKKSK